MAEKNANQKAKGAGFTNCQKIDSTVPDFRPATPVPLRGPRSGAFAAPAPAETAGITPRA
jgi:hypothetical protein